MSEFAVCGKYSGAVWNVIRLNERAEGSVALRVGLRKRGEIGASPVAINRDERVVIDIFFGLIKVNL